MSFGIAFFNAISIHSARVDGDPGRRTGAAVLGIFQSTPPVWAETESIMAGGTGRPISIHSARVGGDIIASVVVDMYKV